MKMGSSLREIYLIFTIAAVACGPRPGKKISQCFDGEGIRYTMDCESQEWANEGRKVKGKGGLHVGDWVGIEGEAESEKVAIREIRDELQNYAAKWSRLCQDFNSCAIKKTEYAEESRQIREVLDKNGFQRHYQAILEAATPDDRRRALADAYEAIVPDERRSDLSLDFSVLGGRTADDLKPLSDGATLHTGDRMAFVINPSREAYLYVMQQTESGEITVLFPDSRIFLTNPVVAGQTVRIPNDGVYRVNEKDIGTEKVFIVVSLKAITSMDEAAAAIGHGEGPTEPVRELSELSNDKAKASSCKTRALELDGPSKGCVRTRGIELDVATPTESTNAPSMRVKTEAADTTIVQIFRFEHLE